MWAATSVFLTLSAATFIAANDLAAHLDMSGLGLSSGDELIGLMARDSEAIPGPIAFGHKYMTGGAGEGEQRLNEEEDFKHRQQVKSDNVLPAYCEPPNPCPAGFTSANGCLEEFENTAEFSREFQSQQKCICDTEHMFNCADKSADEAEESLQEMLQDNGLHQNMIAKKFHQKRSAESYMPRRKRSADTQEAKVNPFLVGEPLKRIQKKDGKNTW